MFTIEQIKTAHSKVKSGADFPAYIHELIKIGVLRYESFVADGHVDYFGSNNFRTSAPPKYDQLLVMEKGNKEQFQNDLKAHQQGQTDYPTFCKHCAKSGVSKWIVDMQKMTCSYFDKAGNELLVELIPE